MGYYLDLDLPYTDLPKPPKWWEIWLAKLLGKKVILEHEGVKTISYFWRNRLYVVKEKRL